MFGSPPSFGHPWSFYLFIAHSIYCMQTICKELGWLACNCWETVGKKLCFFIVYFYRELMKGSGSVSWDSCGCEYSNCFSYVSYVPCYVLYSISPLFLVKFFEWDQVEFNSIALPVGKFHVQCFILMLKRIHVVHALFTFLINLSIYFLCSTVSFVSISGEIFRVRSGRIQFCCSTCGKISYTMFIILFAKDPCCPCPFQILNQSFHPAPF